MSVLIRLVRERLHHLVPAVAVEVGEFDMGAAAGPGECRRRHLLPRERSLAVIQEDQGLAGRGDRDKVLVSVAFKIAGCERDGALANCCREERMAPRYPPGRERRTSTPLRQVSSSKLV